ncbi:hypothetical protein L0P54_10340 [Anaerosalibacter bizertensis]|uniref:Uncharacterized protein n=1 Tax=Anaerosalibacter bizertensis TaxID=932217 RepID=A0A9Q4FMF3_9FIRM|nr:hypothetical protein [Anaerosalibacter bizertensis]MBV1819558.1 hypothetical protein [Bacteroidales bacterium MSK.15.36]MCB5560600.1 hypothetical protein [Anaerosalibacter bizertensis]MCG4565868.1 hypothetical protein [Anaerosalibacter bizertensis]MCG4583386.1 hypothetical protein [Anaerosalibacter bizertensis]
MDTNILYEKIYNGLLKMSKEYSVEKVEEIYIVLNIDKDIKEKDLMRYLKSKNASLFQDLEKIEITKEEIEMITAIITNIKGR